MTSFDTNLLFFAYASDRVEHSRAKSFLDQYSGSREVVISEFVLIEFYRLLRNPVVLKNPLAAKDAVQVVQTWREHPVWPVIGFSSDSRTLHEELWRIAERREFAARRIFDARLALVLRQNGVTEFATANVKDFEGLGFGRVWNPLS
jgi:toxin-antitoxin system PIN domain toxin